MFEPRLVHTEPTTVAYLTMHGAYGQIPEGFATLYEWLALKGFAPAGMPKAVFLTNPAEVPEAEARWELWAPVASGAAQTPDDAGLGVKIVPARTLAVAVHKGPYDSVGATYGELWGWVTDGGYEVVGPPEESYLTDPAEAPPEEYLTEIAFPIRTA